MRRAVRNPRNHLSDSERNFVIRSGLVIDETWIGPIEGKEVSVIRRAGLRLGADYIQRDDVLFVCKSVRAAYNWIVRNAR